jgi:hypothetical protein
MLLLGGVCEEGEAFLYSGEEELIPWNILHKVANQPLGTMNLDVHL